MCLDLTQNGTANITTEEDKLPKKYVKFQKRNSLHNPKIFIA